MKWNERSITVAPDGHENDGRVSQAPPLATTQTRSRGTAGRYPAHQTTVNV